MASEIQGKMASPVTINNMTRIDNACNNGFFSSDSTQGDLSHTHEIL